MGPELFRKYATSSIIVCYRSVVRHPFLVGMILFLFSMYRLFPLLFSVLLSASPVIVSTAVLLGTLLSFGQPNIPEIEEEPESEIRKVESKVMGHTESFASEETNGIEVADRLFEVSNDNSCVEAVNLVDDGLLEFDDEKVVLGSRYSPLQQSEDEHIVLESDKLWEGSADPLNSNSGLLWKGVERNGGDDDDDEDDDDDDDDDDDGSDSGGSGSDLAESSSPDASMADIIPMLDELHPLLSEEQESHQPSHMSHDGTDAVSQHSLESSDTSSESNDDTGIENRENIKNGDDEDEEHVDIEDDTRSAITWTEDDQKNLMNLGTSEMERNRRLETLIARRRARDDTGIENHEKVKIGDDEDEDEDDEHVDKEDDPTSAITWTEDDQKNLMNLGTSEMERNMRLETLIARRRARDDSGIENHEKVKTGDDEVEVEDEDKESEHVDKEDDTRSAITWTEDDQKNLMNLGTSEMERNRRLENLIARRRARKTMRMQAENNPIDLQNAADLPWNIPPISTARSNPFDYDANDDIPGSAPSVLLQRRNPFDLPYDSSEEKPDLVGDTFQQEFAVFQPKEPVFRRHESFNVGPSNFGASRSERQESKLKPYFVPERSFSSFQRQFSGLSDSKASSVPDTESVSSDLENKDHIEEDEHASEIDEHVSDHVSHARPYFVPEHVAADATSFVSFQRQLSEVSDSKVSSESDSESASSAGDLENRDHIDLSLEPDLISLEDHEHDGGVDARGIDEAEISVESVTNQQELHSSGSSLSSLDEASEQIYIEKEGDEVAAGSVSETDYFLDRDSSIERSETGVTGLVAEESQPNEPVYDLSPRSVTRNLSSSSILMDLHKDESFLQNNDHNPSPSSASDVKRNSTESSSDVLEIDNVKPVLEAEDVVLHLAAPDELEEVRVSSSDSHARSLESFQQEDVMTQPDEKSSLGRSDDRPLAEDPEELQAHNLEHGEVVVPSTEAKFTEVVHGETYENHSHGEDISQQKESPLLDTSVSEPLEDNLEVLQVQISSNNSDNLQIQEPDVVEVADVETKAQEIPAYASDTHSIRSNIDDVDEIEEFDEDLLVELDAVGDFSVKDFTSTLNEMKDDPQTSEHDLENKEIAEKDLESNLSEMNQHLHVSEHDLETSHSVGDDSDSSDLGTTLDERNQDPHVLDRDLEAMISGDEDSYSRDLGSTLDEIKQDPHALDRDLETKDSEEMANEPHASDRDLETKHYEEMENEPHASDRDLETKDSEEMAHEPHASDCDLETKHFEEVKRDPHASDHVLETKHSEEMEQDPHALDHDLETKHSEDDSYSKDASLDEMKQNPHDSCHDLETEHSGDEDSTLDEMKQNPHDSSHDLETKHSGDEESTLDEMKQDPNALDHHLETKHSEDDDFNSKNATLNEMNQDPHDSSHDLETKHSVDEDSYSTDLGSTLDDMKQEPHETNQFINEDSYPKDLDTTFNEMKERTHALDHRLETFYSVDENFYSKHVESAFNEMKHDLHAPDQDFETNHSGDTETKMDAEVVKTSDENDISNTKVEGTFQAEASKPTQSSDSNEVVLPQTTESTTSLANTTSATTVNHGTENASTTSNTY